MTDPNPYAPPRNHPADARPHSAVSEHWRLTFTERSLRGLAWLLMTTCVFGMLGSTIALREALRMGRATMWVTAASGFVFTMAVVVVAEGLYRLRSWARLPAILIFTLLVFLFPCGTGVGALGLLYLVTSDVATVLTPEYQAKWTAQSEPPRWQRMTLGVMAILASELLFLWALT